LLYLLS